MLNLFLGLLMLFGWVFAGYAAWHHVNGCAAVVVLIGAYWLDLRLRQIHEALHGLARRSKLPDSPWLP